MDSRPGSRILVVDDNARVAQLLAEVLALDGHEVHTAKDGRTALAMLETTAYDLILTDVWMPGLDGPALYRILKLHHPDLLSRIVFITGDPSEPSTRRFLEAEQVPCLGKPLDLSRILQLIGERTRSARPGPAA